MAFFDDEDWDDGEDEWGDDELTPDEIADIKRAEQDANMGFTYEMTHDEDGNIAFKCNQCGRVGEIRERPFPHKLNCPMRDYDRE
jgi:hypothetical protein